MAVVSVLAGCQQAFDRWQQAGGEIQPNQPPNFYSSTITILKIMLFRVRCISIRTAAGFGRGTFFSSLLCLLQNYNVDIISTLSHL